MNLIKKLGAIKSYNRPVPVTEIILHDTVTSNAKVAISVLQQRGLGYHYLIEKDGTIVQLADPAMMTYHAAGYNKDTVGISYCCGGQFGPVNDVQVAASIDLINSIKGLLPRLKTIAGHKHRSKSGKIDPEGLTDAGFADVAAKTGLTFLRRR